MHLSTCFPKSRDPQLAVASANDVVTTKVTLAIMANACTTKSLKIVAKPTLGSVALSPQIANQWEEKKIIDLIFKNFADYIKNISNEPGYQTQATLMLEKLTKTKDSYFEKAIVTSQEREKIIEDSANIMLNYKPKIEPVAWEGVKDGGITLLNALRTIARCFGANMPRQILFSEKRINKQNNIHRIIDNFKDKDQICRAIQAPVCSHF